MYCLLIKFPAANINKIIKNLCLETVTLVSLCRVSLAKA
jgi:hypothetical protein